MWNKVASGIRQAVGTSVKDWDRGWEDPSRYATFVWGRRVTRWRAYKDALAEAIALGHATQEPGQGPFFWVGVDLACRG